MALPIDNEINNFIPLYAFTSNISPVTSSLLDLVAACGNVMFLWRLLKRVNFAADAIYTVREASAV